MNKWYWQIVIGLVATVLIIVLNEAIYPEKYFPTQESIINSGDARAFYIMAVLSLVAQVLILVGLVRGLWILIRKFRGFVRINK